MDLPFKISTETTRLTEPLLPSGAIDYVRVLNEKLGKGVTAESNALLPLLKIRGTAISVDEPMRAEFLRMAGAKGDEDTSPFFVRYELYLKEREPRADMAQATETLLQATQRPWNQKWSPPLAEYLVEQAGIFAIATDASKKPDFYTPYVSTDGSLAHAGLFKMTGLTDLARSWGARANLRIGSDNISGAIRDIEAMKRLGRLFQRPGTLICAIMGMVFDLMGNRLANTLLRRSLGIDDLQALTKALALPAWESIASYIDGVERWLFLSSLQQHALGLIDLAKDDRYAAKATLIQSIDVSVIDWNAAMRELNAWRDHQIEVVNRTAWREFARGHKELRKVSSKWQKELRKTRSLLQPLAGEARDVYARRVVHGLLAGASDLVRHERTRRQLHSYQQQLQTMCNAGNTPASRHSWWKRLFARRSQENSAGLRG